MKRIITMTAAIVVGSLSMAMAGRSAVADVGSMVVEPPHHHEPLPGGREGHQEGPIPLVGSPVA